MHRLVIKHDPIRTRLCLKMECYSNIMLLRGSTDAALKKKKKKPGQLSIYCFSEIPYAYSRKKNQLKLYLWNPEIVNDEEKAQNVLLSSHIHSRACCWIRTDQEIPHFVDSVGNVNWSVLWSKAAIWVTPPCWHWILLIRTWLSSI